MAFGAIFVYMTRVALIALAALIIFGVVVSVLPAPKSEGLAVVTLEGVKLELYPAADPDATWFFQAKEVRYNPETRESTINNLERGKRIVKNELDSTIQTESIVIDSQDNIRTQQAEIYVLKNCIRVKLGKASGIQVFIDQNQGYRAPYADVRSANYKGTGEPLTASFDLKTKFELGNPKDEFIQGGNERCVNGKLIQEKK